MAPRTSRPRIIARRGPPLREYAWILVLAALILIGVVVLLGPTLGALTH